MGMLIQRAEWSLRVPEEMGRPDAISRLQQQIQSCASRSQYGWGHTIDFGPFTQPGLLCDSYLDIVGGFDQLGWLPARLEGMSVADVGCFTGGISLLLAQRGASLVYAVDELPEHLEQCRIVVEAFKMPQVRPVLAPIWRLEDSIPPGSLDMIVLAGVLYHLSDMLVGLHLLRQLLKPGGVLLIESNAVDDDARSYANFGRFYGGMWWQPTGRCIKDMCEYMGYSSASIEFYHPNRCLGRAIRREGEIDFRRGLNYRFGELRDRRVRSLDPQVMAPARDS